MGKVLTNVFKDSATIYPTGAQRSVDTNSAIVGIRVIKLNEYPLGGGESPEPTKSCLLINDPVLGAIYIGETFESWVAKVGESAVTADGLKTYTWIGGDDVPAGLKITDERLHNIDISTITKGGVAIYNVPYTNTSETEGELDLTLFNGIGEEETIQITYKKL